MSAPVDPTGVGYPYSEGDRLEDRNSYCYSPATGAPLLLAWRAARDAALADLPAPCVPPAAPAALPRPGEPFQTASALDGLLPLCRAGSLPPEAASWLDKLVRRFEVSKRLHGAYDAAFKPVDRADYRTPGLYLRAAEATLRAHAATGDLVCLNAALKLVDTLCAMRSVLDPVQGAWLAAIICSEREAVAALDTGRGVEAWNRGGEPCC